MISNITRIGLRILGSLILVGIFLNQMGALAWNESSYRFVSDQMVRVYQMWEELEDKIEIARERVRLKRELERMKIAVLEAEAKKKQFEIDQMERERSEKAAALELENVKKKKLIALQQKRLAAKKARLERIHNEKTEQLRIAEEKKRAREKILQDAERIKRFFARQAQRKKLAEQKRLELAMEEPVKQPMAKKQDIPKAPRLPKSKIAYMLDKKGLVSLKTLHMNDLMRFHNNQSQPVLRNSLEFSQIVARHYNRLRKLAEKYDANYRIIIEGHSSPRYHELPVDPGLKSGPAYHLNLKISQERAKQVARLVVEALESGGYVLESPSDIAIIGRGFSQPIRRQDGQMGICGVYDCGQSQRVDVVFQLSKPPVRQPIARKMPY